MGERVSICVVVQMAKLGLEMSKSASQSERDHCKIKAMSMEERGLDIRSKLQNKEEKMA